ncbi:MAG: hypothetical protein K8R36_21435 [Planctomycetales bacterium]|nr:hypothetical protein [Planctomycetales bacterium]
MRSPSLAFILLTIIPSLASGEDPARPASAGKAAPALSNEQKQEKNSLLDKKLAELKRLQTEIKQLRDDLNEQQQVGLDLQVYEVNHTKLRNFGFDWTTVVDSASNGPRKDVAGFFKALAHNNLAKIFAGRAKQTSDGTLVNFLFDDGTKTSLSFDCTPTVTENGDIRLKVRYEISRFSGDDFGLRVRAGETTIEVEPDTAHFIAGDSIKRTKANGDKEEIALVFVIKPSLPKR